MCVCLGGYTITSKTKTNVFLKKNSHSTGFFGAAPLKKKFKKVYLAFEAYSALSQIYTFSRVLAHCAASPKCTFFGF